MEVKKQLFECCRTEVISFEEQSIITQSPCGEVDVWEDLGGFNSWDVDEGV